MNSATVISILILVCILFLAIRYIYKKKRGGSKCIGCPCADNCEKRE